MFTGNDKENAEFFILFTIISSGSALGLSFVCVYIFPIKGKSFIAK